MPKILFISTYFPFEPSTGGNQRTYELYEALKDCGDTDIVQVSPPGWIGQKQLDTAKKMENFLGCLQWSNPAFIRGLERIHRRSAHSLQWQYDWMFGNFRADREIVEWRRNNLDGRHYDVVVVRSLWSLCKIDGFHLGPILVDLDDLDHLIAHTMYESTPTAWKRLLLAGPRYLIMREQVIRHARKCTHALFTSDEDFEWCPFITGKVLRHAPAVGRSVPNYNDQGDPNAILALADFMYPSYREGARQFIENSWPIVHSQVPNARLRLVGRISDADRAAWSRVGGIEVSGYVNFDELQSIYKDTGFTVAPIHWGAGSKTKILEAFLYGKTSVITHHAHHGYRFRFPHGESLMVGNTDEQLAEHCITLLRDPARAREMAARGRDTVLRAYNIEGFKSVVASSIENVVSGRS